MKKTYRIKPSSFKHGLPFRQPPGSIGEISFKELVYRKPLSKKIKSILQASFLANKGFFGFLSQDQQNQSLISPSMQEKTSFYPEIQDETSNFFSSPRNQQFFIELDYILIYDNYFYLEYLFDEAFNNFAIYYPFLEVETKKLYLKTVPNLNFHFFFNNFYHKKETKKKNLIEFLTKNNSEFTFEVLAHWSILSGYGFSFNNFFPIYNSVQKNNSQFLDLSNFTSQEQLIIQKIIEKKFKFNLQKFSPRGKNNNILYPAGTRRGYSQPEGSLRSQENTFTVPFSKIQKQFPSFPCKNLVLFCEDLQRAIVKHYLQVFYKRFLF